MPSIIDSHQLSAATGNVTLTNAGANRALAVFVLARSNGYYTPTCTVAVGGVTATAVSTHHTTTYQARAHMYAAVILDAAYPAAGVTAVAASFSQATTDVRIVVVELAGVNQSTPTGTVNTFTNTGSNSPVAATLSLSGATSALALIAAGFASASSAQNGTGAITIDGDAYALESTSNASGSTRIAVFSDDVIAASPQAYTASVSLRSTTTPPDNTLALAVPFLPVPAPSITSVDSDDSISQGQQDIVINVSNIPTGMVPIRAGAGGTSGVGGTDFTGFSVVAGAAGAFTITCDVPIGIATSASTECYVEYDTE